MCWGAGRTAITVSYTHLDVYKRQLISYDVDARHLEEGESINGAFFLVSNGGEYTIPYRFTVQVAAASRYGQLKTVEQFAQMVQAEPDTALRLFDSDEFARLPFLQDLPARAMYDGLCRGGSRRNAHVSYTHLDVYKRQVP